MDNNDSDGDGDSYDDEGDGGDDIFGNEDKSMTAEKDPSKLLDLELVNLLKFCN